LLKKDKGGTNDILLYLLVSNIRGGWAGSNFIPQLEEKEKAGREDLFTKYKCKSFLTAGCTLRIIFACLLTFRISPC